MILGNINISTIEEIWNSETYNKIRKQLYYKNYEKVPTCRSCSIWNENSK